MARTYEIRFISAHHSITPILQLRTTAEHFLLLILRREICSYETHEEIPILADGALISDKWITGLTMPAIL